MADEMRLPTFRGDGYEDLDQHWFLCEDVWSIVGTGKIQGSTLKSAPTKP
jgi:hypothetical protein